MVYVVLVMVVIFCLYQRDRIVDLEAAIRELESQAKLAKPAPAAPKKAESDQDAADWWKPEGWTLRDEESHYEPG